MAIVTVAERTMVMALTIATTMAMTKAMAMGSTIFRSPCPRGTLRRSPMLMFAPLGDLQYMAEISQPSSPGFCLGIISISYQPVSHALEVGMSLLGPC